jgi:hypothetical protein
MAEPYSEWARAEPRALARYVEPKGLPEEFKLPKYISRFDLVQSEGPRGLAAQLYVQICKQAIQYDLAPFDPHSEVTQLIRKPETLLAEKRGTCLDLAVLFAAMCLANDLLPLIVVVEGHAFVGLSLTRTRDKKKPAPRALAWNKGLLEELSTLEELTGSEYFFVECTGAAHSYSLSSEVPEGHGRNENGLMSFEDACKAGEDQLLQHAKLANDIDPNRRSFLYALDIHDLQVKYGFKPIQERAPTSPPDLSSALQQAEDLISTRSYGDATRLLALIVARFPQAPKARLLYALTWLEGRNPELLAAQRIRLIESHLVAAQRSQETRFLALVIQAVIKHDFYSSNGMNEGDPKLDQLLAQIKSEVQNSPAIPLLKHVNAKRQIKQRLNIEGWR